MNHDVAKRIMQVVGAVDASTADRLVADMGVLSPKRCHTPMRRMAS